MAAIDRAALDLALRESAVAKGAELRLGRAITAIEPAAGGGWSLIDVADGREPAAVVIDATGKAAFSAGKLLAVTTEAQPLDPRSSVFTHFERAEPFGVDAVTLIASADGFFYLVPLHAHRLCVGRVCYGGSHPDEAGFLASIAACPPLGARVAGATRVLPMLPAKNAASIVTPAAPGIFATGDALGFRDSFLWDGIFHALSSGFRAGELAADVVRGSIGEVEAAVAFATVLRDIERQAVVATEAALAPFATALSPIMLLDPHMPPALLTALLGLARPDAKADARDLRRRRRAGLRQTSLTGKETP